MGTITLTDDVIYSMSAADPRSSGTVLQSTGTVFSYLARDNSVVTLVGSGFTYGGAPGAGPTGGTISEVRITPANTAANEPLTIATSLPAADLPIGSLANEAAFWEPLLAGADTFDLSGGAATLPLGSQGSIFGGDGTVWTGAGGVGAKDVMTMGDAAGFVVGDHIFVGSTSSVTDYVGGNDNLQGGTGSERQSFVGDVDIVRWTADMTGGNDTIVMRTEGNAFGDVYRQLYGGRFEGGDDTISVFGTGERKVFGDAFELDDFNSALTVVAGDDTIDASGASGPGPTTLVGDVDAFILSRASGLPGRQVVLGNDTMVGSDGADTIIGDVRFASTTVTVRLGDDDIEGGAGDDVIYGDVVTFGNGTNLVLFAGGDDRIDGGAGNDEVNGGLGRDVVTGGFGADTLRGDGGNDVLYGQVGLDILEGGFGDDRLIGGKSADVLDGGAGRDSASYQGAASGVAIDLALGGGGTKGEALGDTFSGIESAIGSDFDDVLRGFEGVNALFGGGGDDTVDGRGGNDSVKGDAGDDRVIGGAGNDRLEGGSGADTFIFRAGDGRDRVVDYVDGLDGFDYRQHTGVNAFSDLTITAFNGSAIIDDGAGGIVVVSNAAGQLDQGDFIF